MHVHVHMGMHMHMHMHTSTVRGGTCTCTCTCAYARARAHVYAYAHAHAHVDRAGWYGAHTRKAQARGAYCTASAITYSASGGSSCCVSTSCSSVSVVNAAAMARRALSSSIETSVAKLTPTPMPTAAERRARAGCPRPRAAPTRVAPATDAPIAGMKQIPLTFW